MCDRFLVMTFFSVLIAAVWAGKSTSRRDCVSYFANVYVCHLCITRVVHMCVCFDRFFVGVSFLFRSCSCLLSFRRAPTRRRGCVKSPRRRWRSRRRPSPLAAQSWRPPTWLSTRGRCECDGLCLGGVLPQVLPLRRLRPHPEFFLRRLRPVGHVYLYMAHQGAVRRIDAPRHETVNHEAGPCAPFFVLGNGAVLFKLHFSSMPSQVALPLPTSPYPCCS